MNNSAIFKLGYGLYVVTARHGEKDNGCIINTVMQVTSGHSLTGVIGVNKRNHTHDMIMASKKFNISVLTTETPFDAFKHFGSQSGAKVDKFFGYKEIERSKNGIIYLTKHANAYLSFEVTDAINFGSHTMFKAEITDGEVIGEGESLTYAYYQEHIKPQIPATVKAGYRCNACGYIYEGEDLSFDFICPLCNHDTLYFVKI
jgi:flavin reductase (DIM6/NTAB) family NADH-FMN oxidoreductase RutF/rubredoxin